MVIWTIVINQVPFTYEVNAEAYKNSTLNKKQFSTGQVFFGYIKTLQPKSNFLFSSKLVGQDQDILVLVQTKSIMLKPYYPPTPHPHTHCVLN